MSRLSPLRSPQQPQRGCDNPGAAIRVAVRRGLVAGSRVRLGIVEGMVIGYNIARGGRYPGARFPLLVSTELGVAKCRLDEVAAAFA